MRWPFVSRARYDECRREQEFASRGAERLTTQVNELRTESGLALREMTRRAELAELSARNLDDLYRATLTELTVARDRIADVEAHRQEWSKMASDSNAQADIWMARANAADRRYDTLLDKYHALKLAGASTPPPIAPRPEPDPVTQAMIARAHGSPILMRQFQGYVHERRAANVMEADIAAEIYAGVSDEDGIP